MKILLHWERFDPNAIHKSVDDNKTFAIHLQLKNYLVNTADKSDWNSSVILIITTGNAKCKGGEVERGFRS